MSDLARQQESLVNLVQFFHKDTHWRKHGKKVFCRRGEPIRKSIIAQHLSGGDGFGLAFIEPGTSVTRAAAIDLDDHDGVVGFEQMRQKLKDVCATLTARGYRPHAFTSSGGKGYHIYLLWDKPQDTYSVREMLRGVLIESLLREGTAGVAKDEAEIFAKQDSVPADGVGSMIVLPLSGESVYLDPLTFTPQDVVPVKWAVCEMDVPVVAKPLTPKSEPSNMPGSSTATNLADIRSALHAIPNEGDQELDYDAWRNVIFAIHYASNGSAEGLALAHEFSQRAEGKYDAEFLDERVWPYVRSGRSNAITERTLFDMARKAGWQECSPEDFPLLEEEEEEGGEDAPFKRTLSFLALDEVLARPEPNWIIKGVLPETQGYIVLYGESTAGKSFIALDVAMAVARGEPWRDRRVARKVVGYVAAEGAHDFCLRVKAYMEAHLLRPQDVPFLMMDACPNLTSREEVKRLVAAVKAAGVELLLIDTYAQVTPGADENSTQDTTRFIGFCKQISKATGVTIVLVHHAGKDPTRGARGSSALKAAADAELEVTRNNDLRVLRIAKMKGGLDGMGFCFLLNIVQLGVDKDGDPITSCVVRHVEGVPKQEATKRTPGHKNEKIMWEVINKEIGVDGQLKVDDALAKFEDAFPVDPDKKRNRPRERGVDALKGLANGKFIEIENNTIRVLV